MNLENVNPEPTTATDEQGATATEATENTETADSTTQNDISEPTTAEDISHGNDGEAVPDFSLDIEYNRETKTLSHDEAVDLAQKGIFFKEKGLEQLYNKLDYVAAQKGVSVAEVVDGIIASDEAQKREEYAQRFGDDTETIEIMMNAYKNGQKEKYDKVLKARENADETAKAEKKASTESRLAEEFTELKAEFPDIKDFASLPKSVIDTSASTGKDLLSCYLRYRRQEEKKIAEETRAAENAAKASTGSGVSAPLNVDGEMTAMLRGLWNS